MGGRQWRKWNDRRLAAGASPSASTDLDLPSDLSRFIAAYLAALANMRMRESSRNCYHPQGKAYSDKVSNGRDQLLAACVLQLPLHEAQFKEQYDLNPASAECRSAQRSRDRLRGLYAKMQRRIVHMASFRVQKCGCINTKSGDPDVHPVCNACVQKKQYVAGLLAYERGDSGGYYNSYNP